MARQHGKILRASALSVVAAALVLPNIGSVAAHTFRSASNVTIALDGDTFRGSVHSDRAACERGRSVVVREWVKDGPDQNTRPDTRFIGSDRTDRQGNWALPTDPQPDRGRYFARARGRTTGGYGHAHRCGGDRSATLNTNN